MLATYFYLDDYLYSSFLGVTWYGDDGLIAGSSLPSSHSPGHLVSLSLWCILFHSHQTTTAYAAICATNSDRLRRQQPA